MTRVWLAVALCSATFGSTTYTYNDTGNTVYCSYGTCPANITSDYATASVTLNAPALPIAAPNFLAPNNQQYLVSWAVGDALGNIKLASTDADASSELVTLAFNGTGTNYTIVSAMPHNMFDIFSSPRSVPSVDGGTYQVADHLQVFDGSWQAVSPDPGQWSVMVNGQEGGTASAPVFLTTGLPVTSVSGTTSGAGSTDYYAFYWAGGAFSAETTFPDVPSSSLGDSFQFSLGVFGSCNTLASVTLDNSNGYTGTISQGNLSASNYCIGIDQTAGSDPGYVTTFVTPLSAAPEPAAFVLVAGGLAALCAVRRLRNSLV